MNILEELDHIESRIAHVRRYLMRRQDVSQAPKGNALEARQMRLIRKAAQHIGITCNELIRRDRRRRTGRHARVRRIIIYIMATRWSMSKCDVTEAVGVDRSYVPYAIRTVDERLETGDRREIEDYATMVQAAEEIDATIAHRAILDIPKTHSEAMSPVPTATSVAA